jgi:CheY-like chemotaxis protein
MALFDKVWQQMNTHLDQAKIGREIEQLRQVLQAKPNDTDALRQLGILYETCGKPEEASHYFITLAKVYQQSGQGQLAIAYYRKTERLVDKEERASILKEVEKICHEMKQYEEAYRTCRQIIEVYLELNQKEAGRGFLQTLLPLGEKDAVYRKELREMIGERDDNWAQGARGSWIAENTARPTQALDSLPGYTTARVPVATDNEKAAFANLLVLVVDDDPGVCKIVSTMLKTMGCQAVTASDGLEGLDKALQLRPQLIISDLLMPRMDGSQLFDQLRQYPETREIPFVCLTSRGQEDEKLAAFEKGVEDYWVKPFVLSEISMRTRKLLMRQLHQHQPRPSFGAMTAVATVPQPPPAELAGRLTEVPPSHLLRMIEFMRKTGTLTLTKSEVSGNIFFQGGEIIDADFSGYTGEIALCNLMAWADGYFTFRSGVVNRPRRVQGTLDELFARVNRYYQIYALLSRLPGMEKIVVFSNRLQEIMRGQAVPPIMEPMLHLMDGRRTLGNCLEELNHDETAIRLLVDLYEKGLLVPVN